MAKIYTFFAMMIVGLLATAQAQVNVSSVGETYSQDFNTLDTSGTANVLAIPGWQISAANYSAGNGSGNTGAIYSFGSNGSTDRALGGLVSGNVNYQRIYFGAAFKNNSGQELNEFNITYAGEQWRRGAKTLNSNPVGDTLILQYSLNATSVTDQAASWVSVPALNFTSPFISGADTAVNGNSVRSVISGKFNKGLAADATIYIRWAYVRNTGGGLAGSRDGLGVDDLQVTFGYDPTWVDEGGETCDFDTEAIPALYFSNYSDRSIYLEFEPIEGASGYIVLLDKKDPDDEEYAYGFPVDGQTYTVGQTISSSLVVGILEGDAFSFFYGGLEPDTYYEIYVQPFYNCENSIFYGEGFDGDGNYTGEAKCADINNFPQITSFVPTPTSFTITFNPVPEADAYLILLDEVTEDIVYGEPVEGQQYIVGQYIEDSKVVYIGDETTVTVDGLAPDTDYGVWIYPMYDCEAVLYGLYSGDYFTTPVATGIKNNVQAQSLTIYPNPVSGKGKIVNVKMDAAAAKGVAEFQLFNVVGAELASWRKPLASNMSFDLPAHLPAGRYTIRMNNNGTFQLGSFVVVE